MYRYEVGQPYNPNLELLEGVYEVMAEALARGEARIEQRGTEDWWVDPMFGDDTPVLKLGYDADLGLVDRRTYPKPEQA